MIHTLRNASHDPFAAKHQRKDLEEKIQVVGYVEQNTKFLVFEKVSNIDSHSYRVNANSNQGTYKRKASNKRAAQKNMNSSTFDNNYSPRTKNTRKGAN